MKSAAAQSIAAMTAPAVVRNAVETLAARNAAEDRPGVRWMFVADVEVGMTVLNGFRDLALGVVTACPTSGKNVDLVIKHGGVFSGQLTRHGLEVIAVRE